MSSYKANDMFGSGPHRFASGPVGLVTRDPFQAPNEFGIWDSFGALAEEVVQTGRLVASTSAALMALWEAIRIEAEASGSGTLVDDTGFVRTAMVMTRATMTGPIVRGAFWSVPYEIEYRKDPA